MPPTRRALVKEALWAYLELAVLWTFAVAQPLFDLLKDNPEFFAARGSSGFDVVSFSVLLVVLPPAVLLALELLLGLAHRSLRGGAHITILGALAALFAAQAVKKSIGGSDATLIAVALAIGIGLALLYARQEPVRSFLRILSPAPLLFLVLFLFASPVSDVAFPDQAEARSVGGVTRTPIVVVLLDELPVETLIGEGNRIDAARFPGFGELARSATWLRNAYTVYDSTERAQPAIMDGNLPDADRRPTSSDHPNSIFSLFGKTHRMNVSEEATSVCSRDLCEDARADEPYRSRISSMAEDLGLVWLHVVSPPKIENDLPNVSENWGNFGGGDEDKETKAPGNAGVNTRFNLNRGRGARFAAWTEAIVRGTRPALNFKHTLLPHVPWQYLPSGRQYRRTANDALPGLSDQSFNDQGQLDVLLQRHFLQTGYADLQLQQLWRHLRRKGLWDDALIVVAADHGVAFRRGRRDRRRLDRKNAAEIAPIPLLIKAPGQKRGRIDDAYVETIDILPTIFDLLDLDPKVKMDGKSAFSKEVRARDELRILLRNSFDVIRIPGAQFQREKRTIVRRNRRLFGTGRDGPERIYRIGPDPGLIGKPASQAGEKLPVTLAYANDYKRVDPDSAYIPTHVVGRVTESGGQRNVAVAVNGTIAAVGTTFELATGEQGELISMLVPESAFRAGRNTVEVLAVP